jgi:uncharacterized protein (TIGR02246 family)
MRARRVQKMFCKEPKNEAEFRVGFGFRRDRGAFGGGLRERSAEDEATIRAYSANASEAARTKDVDKVASFYADDALAFSNYSATTTTKEAMRADMRKSFSDPGTISWKTSAIEVARSGDLAYEHGRYTFTTTEKDGKSKTQTGNYLLVWRKPPRGDWKIAVDTDSEDPPLAPLAPLPLPTK